MKENGWIITKANKEAIPDIFAIAVDIVNDIREGDRSRDEVEADLEQVIKDEYCDDLSNSLDVKVYVAAHEAVIRALGLQEIVLAVEGELKPRVVEEVRRTLQKQLEAEEEDKA